MRWHRLPNAVRTLQSIARALKGGSEAVGAIAFAAMFLVFLLQIFMRYVVNAPLSWTIEACSILYVWITFWGAAFMVRRRDHITFSMIVDAAPAPVRAVLGVIGGAMLIAAFATALPGTLDYVDFMAGKKTPVMRLTYLIVYGLFPVFLVAVILRTLGDWAIDIRRARHPA